MSKSEEARSVTLRRIQRRRKLASVRKTIVASALVVAAFVTYCTVSRLPSSLSDAMDSETARNGQVESTDVAAATPEVPAARALPPEPSIPIDESDPFVRLLAPKLSSNPLFLSWSANDDLIRRLAASVGNVSEGLSPRKQLEFLAPKTPFTVVERDDRVFMDPRSAERYDGLAEAFVSLDVDVVTAAYQRLRPLLFAAYAELGYPESNFEDGLVVAIEEVWSTPVRAGDIELVASGAGYQYADPELESLSGAQKQFFRMGSQNQQRVRSQLAKILQALDFTELELPNPERADAPTH